MLTLYISGPMGGKPNHNFPAFMKAEDLLLQAGFRLLNPARNHPKDGSASREHYMRLDYGSVLQADGLALLPGHHYSPGAQSEIRAALDLGIPIATVDWWVLLGKPAGAALHALRSYEHGNGSPELARQCANAIEQAAISMQLMARSPESRRPGVEGGEA